MITSMPKTPKPRLTIVTNGNFFSRLALGHLFSSRASDFEFQVFITTGLRRQRGHRLSEALRLSRVWGMRYTAYKLATYLLPALAEIHPARCAFVKRLCQRHGIAVRRVRNVNDPATVNAIRNFAPDLLVSFSCPYRIREPLLSLPRVGCLNVHSSYLPAYAGVCTYVHVLANGESFTGVTVHEMVKDFDAGRLVGQERVPISPGMSVFGLFARQCLLAGPLLARALDACLEANAIVGAPQDLAARSYHGEPTADDIRRLRANGFSLWGPGDLALLRRLCA
ncbi:MAG: methionyl-tRNA formyltransferase [Candidatus Krumholzibacteriia bacterium]